MPEGSKSNSVNRAPKSVNACYGAKIMDAKFKKEESNA